MIIQPFKDEDVVWRWTPIAELLRQLAEKNEEKAFDEHRLLEAFERINNQIERLAEKDAETAKLNAMRTHCPDCGGDYMATGIEAGCPCKLQTRVAELYAALAKKNAEIEQLNKLPLRVSGLEEILEKCLRILDPAPDGKCSRIAAKLVPCLLYGGVPDKIAKLKADLAAERERCRQEEVAPLMTALTAMQANLRDQHCWQENIRAVEQIQKEKP